ncbi:hypothetical protein K501DRAFT_309464 [Backusella circina FSU 941]|nr:hypothetical protein K501DRAFT_309464 [Backusella circina FSU 941]
MDKLSTELLSLVFSYLHREQKLQCKLVCRTFANALRNGQDLETIVMSYWPSSDHYGKSFTNLVQQVRDDPTIGKKCKRLVLDGQLNISFDKAALGELFPNLNSLFLGTGGLITLMNQTKYFPRNTKMGPDPLQHWRENLETLFIESEIMFYFDILDDGVFRNLTTLVLGAENEHQTMGFSGIFESFHNTPALKNLVIAWSHVLLNELEKLHENTPKLESLVLLAAGFSARDKNRPVNQPATLLKKLVIKSQSVRFGIPREVAEYVVQKYPNMEDFSLLLNQTTFQINIIARDNMESSLRHILTELGPNLKKVKLRLPYAVSDTIDILSETTGQLQELRANASCGKKILYKILTYAKDFNIQTLYLTQLPSFHFSVLKSINGLKSLGLVYKEKMRTKETVKLNSLLREVASSIESLEIGNAIVNIKSGKCYPSNIRTLILKTSTVPTELQGFLTQYFHQLKSLTLSQCQVHPVFELPQHHLSYVEINILRDKEPHCIRTDTELEKYKHKVTHLQVTLGETTCHYRFPTELKTENHPLQTHQYFDRHDHGIRFVCIPTEFEDDLSYFQFKCASAQTIFYNGHLVL